MDSSSIAAPIETVQPIRTMHGPILLVESGAGQAGNEPVTFLPAQLCRSARLAMRDLFYWNSNRGLTESFHSVRHSKHG